MASLVGKKNPKYRHGLAPQGKRSSLYASWQNMKQRCTNPNHPKYHRYGARGVQICEAWLTIEGFSQWAFSAGWKEGLTIDRIDNDGDYIPKNCQWIKASDNSRKKQTTKISKQDAQRIREQIKKGDSNKEIAKQYSVAPGTIHFIRKDMTHVY